MIDIDISLVYQMINFLVLVAVLNFVLYRPVRGILKQRAEKMAKLSSDITTSEQGAKAKAEELEAQRAEARRKGATVQEELKGQGRDQERELIETATREMEQAVEKVRVQISQDIGAARDDLKAQVKGFGLELAQKILGRSIQ